MPYYATPFPNPASPTNRPRSARRRSSTTAPMPDPSSRRRTWCDAAKTREDASGPKLHLDDPERTRQVRDRHGNDRLVRHPELAHVRDEALRQVGVRRHVTPRRALPPGTTRRRATAGSAARTRHPGAAAAPTASRCRSRGRYRRTRSSTPIAREVHRAAVDERPDARGHRRRRGSDQRGVVRRAVIDVWIPRPDEAEGFETLVVDIHAWLDAGRGVVVHYRVGIGRCRARCRLEQLRRDRHVRERYGTRAHAAAGLSTRTT